MDKFKIGDRVRVVGGRCRGMIGTIVCEGEHSSITIKVDEHIAKKVIKDAVMYRGELMARLEDGMYYIDDGTFYEEGAVLNNWGITEDDLKLALIKNTKLARITYPKGKESEDGQWWIL